MSETDTQEYPFRNPTALEPPEEWAALREGCPVAPIRLASGDEALLLTRYEDVKQVLSDPRFTRRLDAEGAARVTANESGGVFGMAAANRDESAFEHADAMDLHRTPNAHLAFGVGPHSCLGQALARTELQAVLKVLMRRVPTLDLAVPADTLARREGLLVGGLQQVPVSW